MKGWLLALCEIFLFFGIFKNIIDLNDNFKNIDPITTYWLGFTTLTGLWEIVYISSKKQVNTYANHLIAQKESVWSSDYSLRMLLPNNFSKIFYSEYAAWSDREYMYFSDDWSIIIEGSHCAFCGLFSFLALCSVTFCNQDAFYITLSFAMGTQFMNSLLYLSEYFIQTNDINSCNYSNKEFPLGPLCLGRPFMYINILWLLLPLYCTFSNFTFI